MTTNYKSPIISSGSNVLGSWECPATDLAVLAMPELVAWWRTDSPPQAEGAEWVWRDVKNGYRLIALDVKIPTVASSRIGSKSAIEFGALNKGMWNGDGSALWGLTGDFTVAVIGRGHTTDSNWYPYGTYVASADQQALLRLSTGAFRTYQDGDALATSGTTHTANREFYAVDSFDDTNNLRILHVNGTQELSTGTTTKTVKSNALLVGMSVNPVSAAGGATSCVSEVMIFNIALGAAANAAKLTVVHNRITAYYSDATWG